jgi:hypothetical protein
MRFFVAVVLLCAFLFSAKAEGSTLYSSGISGSLYQLSQVNGAATKIGTTSQFQTRDMASDTRPASFRMWTTNTASQLVSIDRTTGAGTVVGVFSVPGMRALAFDIVGGKLYGLVDGSGGPLYEINTETAAATLIGPVRAGNFGALGADAAGNLFTVDEFTGELYKLDKATAASTLVTTLPVTRISDLAFRPEDGQLFASTLTTGSAPTWKSLFTIDIVNGTATRLGEMDPNESLNGLAFGPGVSVPEPASVALMALAATIFVRRRRV